MENKFENDLMDILNPSDSTSDNQNNEVKENKNDRIIKPQDNIYKTYPEWFEIAVRIFAGLIVAILLLLFGVMISQL